MKFAPQTSEGWERFWLVLLGTVVVGVVIFIGQFRSPYFARRAAGEWVEIVLILATAALGIYSVVLLFRGRILLALIGFAIFVLGSWRISLLSAW
jgi:hypothetical protein